MRCAALTHANKVPFAGGSCDHPQDSEYSRRSIQFSSDSVVLRVPAVSTQSTSTGCRYLRERMRALLRWDEAFVGIANRIFAEQARTVAVPPTSVHTPVHGTC